MTRSVNQVSLQIWRDRLEQFGKAHVTVGQFCKSINVSVATFYYWKQKLAGIGPIKGRMTTGAPLSAPGRAVAPNSRAFVPVLIGPKPVDERVTIEFVDGKRISVPCEAVAALRVVVQELQMRAE